MTILHTAHLRVREDAVPAFEERLRRHAATTLAREPGCRQFDVHRNRDDPGLFLLVERYRDDAALEEHQRSAHFRAFQDDTRAWVIERTWWFWHEPPAPSGSGADAG